MLQCINCFPINNFENLDIDKIKDCLIIFNDDFSLNDLTIIEEEIEKFKNYKKFLSIESFDKLLKIFYSEKINIIFPLLSKLLEIVMTISVTSANSERSFSKMKLIKSYLRTKMTQERMSSLMIISMEKELLRQINDQELLFIFSNKKNRRLDFLSKI